MTEKFELTSENLERFEKEGITNRFEEEIDLPVDKVELPSQGLLYNSRRKLVTIKHLTTEDENVLSSKSLKESGDLTSYLVDRKIVEKDLSSSDMFLGDQLKILIALRITGFGPLFETEVLDRYALIEKGVVEYTKVVFDLNEFKDIPIGASPDEDMLFLYELPLSKHQIKFKLLTIGQENRIKQSIEAKQKTGFLDKDKEYFITYSNMESIQKIKLVNTDKWITDRSEIEKIYKKLALGDGQKFRDYFNSISPGVDLSQEFESKRGGRFRAILPIRQGFFS